jgi:hypothetical protein
VWQSVQAGSAHVISSELSLLETLVGPYKRNDPVLAADYERFFQQPGVRLAKISDRVLRDAPRLRATNAGLRTFGRYSRGNLVRERLLGLRDQRPRFPPSSRFAAANTR